MAESSKYGHVDTVVVVVCADLGAEEIATSEQLHKAGCRQS